MNTTVVVTTLLYLAITAGLGYLGYRQTTSAKDYLLAGRTVHPVIMAISYGSTFISTAAIVGFGGAAAVFGPQKGADAAMVARMDAGLRHLAETNVPREQLVDMMTFIITLFDRFLLQRKFIIRLVRPLC